MHTVVEMVLPGPLHVAQRESHGSHVLPAFRKYPGAQSLHSPVVARQLMQLGGRSTHSEQMADPELLWFWSVHRVHDRDVLPAAW